MSILTVEGLAHAFGEKTLYAGAAFELNRGEHMGVVGQNGTGKSTLIKILLGGIIPTAGRVAWQNGVRLGYIDQHADLSGAPTVDGYLRTAFDELYATERELLGIYKSMETEGGQRLAERAARLQAHLEARDFYSVDTRIARVAEGLGLTAIGMERAPLTLSGGQQTKLLLARLLLSGPDALLLDEPTNFLDAEHIAWLTEFLRAFEGSFVIVSHDFHFLERVTDCICDIEFGTIKKYYGKYSDFVRQKTQQRADYARQYQAQQKEVEKLEEYVAKNKARASTAKLARSRQKKLDRMDRMPPPSVLAAPRIAFPPAAVPAGRALEVHDLMIGYGTPLLPRLRFHIDGGRKAVVTGFNGIGKSTLLKTLMGQLPALGGRHAFAPGVRAAYFEQELRWASPASTPVDIVARAYPALSQKQARGALARCGVQAKQAMQGVASLSGGEQNKVKLCLLMLQGGNFLILDEPTNHLDAETKGALKQALSEYQGSVLLVCHEKAFYEGFADSVIDIERLLKR